MPNKGIPEVILLKRGLYEATCRQRLWLASLLLFLCSALFLPPLLPWTQATGLNATCLAAETAPSPAPANSTTTPTTSPLMIAGMSLFFVIWLTFLFIMAFRKGLTVGLVARFGWSKPAWFVVFAIIGLIAALTLFGFLHSIGEWSGTFLGGALKLGGPVVAFFLTIGFGLKYLPKEDFSVSVYVHRENAQNILITQGVTALTLHILDGKRSPINDGIASFPFLSGAFRGEDKTITLESRYYAPVGATIRLDERAYLPVRRIAEPINGRAQYEDGRPVVNARVSVGKESAQTDASGAFSLTLPGESLEQLGPPGATLPLTLQEPNGPVLSYPYVPGGAGPVLTIKGGQ
jgi:hypothetical protein